MKNRSLPSLSDRCHSGLGGSRMHSFFANIKLVAYARPASRWRLALRPAAVCELGSELIEYALVLPALMFMLLGIAGMSILGYTYHFTAYAAREATRYAMVRGSTWGTTTCSTTTTFACNASADDVTKFVRSLVTQGISSGSALTVSTTWPGTGLAGAATSCPTATGRNSPGCLVKVTVSYSYTYNIAMLPASTFNFAGSSQVVVVQ